MNNPPHFTARFIAMPRLVIPLMIALLAGLGFSLSASAQQPSATAELSPASTTPGQAVNYVVNIEGGQLSQEPAFNFPAGITNGGLTGNQSSVSLVNGVQSISTQLSWAISAAQVGEYVIPAQQIVVNGQAVTLNETKLSVTANPQAQNANGADGQGEFDPILQLSVGKTEFYLGEIIPITAVLYIPRGVSVQRLGLVDANNGNFAIQRFPQQPEQSMQKLGNRTYTALTFRSTFSALKAGILKVGPGKCELALGIPMQGNRMGGFGFGFMQMESRKANAVANEIPVKVMALPTEGKPKNFSGAVGDFTIAATTNDTNVTVGQPVNVEIAIAGQGNFDAINAPALSDPTGWKPYPPRRYDMNSGDANTRDMLNRRIGFSAILVPEKVHTAVPSFDLSFFNPISAQYVTLRSQAIPINVTPGTAPVAAAPASNAEGANSGPAVMDTVAPVANISDILMHIPAAPRWAVASPALLSNTGYLASNVALLLALIGIIVAVLMKRAAARRAASAEHLRSLQLREVEASIGSEPEFYRSAVHFIHNVCPGSENAPEVREIMQRYELVNFTSQPVTPQAVDANVAARVITTLRGLKPSKSSPTQISPLLANSVATTVSLIAMTLCVANFKSVGATEASSQAKPSRPSDTELAAGYTAIAKAMESKDYKAAEKQAKAIVEAGALAPELFELLGHSRFRQENSGEAALWYQRASLFPGSQPEVQQNLRYISERNHYFAPKRDELIDSFTRFFSRNGWAYLATAAAWLVLFSITYLILAPRRTTVGDELKPRPRFVPLAICGIIAGVLITALGIIGWTLRPNYADVSDLYCVTANKAQARTAATATSGSVISVPAGSIIHRISERGAWSYVQIDQPGESLRGWLETDTMVPLWPYPPAMLP